MEEADRIEENTTLENELESSEKESKNLNKILKQNEKKVYDLEKENKKDFESEMVTHRPKIDNYTVSTFTLCKTYAFQTVLQIFNVCHIPDLFLKF